MAAWIWLRSSNGAAPGHTPNPLEVRPNPVKDGYPWLPPKPLNAQRAFGYLESLCKFGSRTSGTQGMERQQHLLEEHFQKLGGTILWQSFSHRHPETGQPVEIKNLIVRWNPDVRERVLVCTHYDTRPFPSQDATHPRGLFLGANDGGSGTALLMELGHAMSELHIASGVDFVFFDAEELVYEEQRDRYFVGSEHFAQMYADSQSDPKQPRYRAGVLIDMIGDAELQLYYEKNSFSFAKGLTVELWEIAKKLKIREFEPRIVHEVRDDHLPLNMIARIPVVDIIDFDYPKRGVKGTGYWHTMGDTPDKCSGLSIVKVAAVLLQWIQKQP